MDSPFHRGELALQQRAGARERLDAVGRRFIRGTMPDQHRVFFAQLPLVFFGTVDETGQPWASLLAGPPGFVQSPDPRSLTITAAPSAFESLAGSLAVGARIGLLGLEHHSRRRNRVNGTVRALGAGRVEIAVDQSFGNCPKYINRRLLRWHPRRESAAAPSVAERLCDRARAVVESADTLYIASSYRPDETGRKYGLDMSHRGGLPGFVEVGKDGSLAVPDYSGNSFFNTLGNILEDGRCGLLFLDFETGDIVQVAGDGEVDWPGESRDEGTVPARFLRVRPAQVRTLPGALPLSAELIDYSPHLRPGAPG